MHDALFILYLGMSIYLSIYLSTNPLTYHEKRPCIPILVLILILIFVRLDESRFLLCTYAA
jgi:hypothetical protein